MPRCDEHGHYESRCPDCAQAFGHDDTISGLRADVERLTRELSAARALIRDSFEIPRCSQCGESGTCYTGRFDYDSDGVWSLFRDVFCASHAPPEATAIAHADAIRAAERDGG